MAADLQLPTSWLDKPFSEPFNDGYGYAPFLEAWYVPDEIEEDPIFQQKWRRMMEEESIAREESWKSYEATGHPHLLVVNAYQFVNPELERTQIPFGPVDDWGNQHALDWPSNWPKPDQSELRAEMWRDSLSLPPLRNQRQWYHPDTPAALEFEAKNTQWDQASRFFVNRSGHLIAKSSIESNEDEEFAQSSYAEFAVKQHHAEIDQLQRAKIVMPQRTEIVVPQFSEPSDVSQSEAEEAIKVHGVMKKKQTRQKKPTVSKTKKRRTRSDLDIEEEAPIYEMDPLGYERKVWGKSLKRIPSTGSTTKSAGVKKTKRPRRNSF